MGTGRRRLSGRGGRRPAAGRPRCRWIRRADDAAADDGRVGRGRAARPPWRPPGPGGGPSPHVRLVAPTDPTGDGTLRLRVAVPAPGIARITRVDGSAVTADTDVAGDGGATTARRRGWSTSPDGSRYGGSAAIRPRWPTPSPSVSTRRGPGRRPGRRIVRPSPPSGGFHFAYRRDGGRVGAAGGVHGRAQHVGRRPVRVRARPHRPLPLPRRAPDRSARGRAHAGAVGRRTDPAHAARRPRRRAGCDARDWLKVVVSDVDFDAAAFDLPQLDEPVPARRPPAARRGARSPASPPGP